MMTKKKEAKMSTDTATRVLAAYWTDGEVTDPDLRQAMEDAGAISSDYAWERYRAALDAHLMGPKSRRTPKAEADKAKPRELRLQEMPSQLHGLASQWHWEDVDHLIRVAYGLLHADPPAVPHDNHGLAYHRGEHPIQQARA